MTTMKPPPNGAVFMYPYVWAYQSDLGQLDAKDRTCCLAFTMKDATGAECLVVLPISDQKGEDPSAYVEVTAFERQRAGLDPARPAYVHVSEHNFDRFVGSWFYNARIEALGRFSDSFTRAILEALAGRLKLKKSRHIDRRR